MIRQRKTQRFRELVDLHGLPRTLAYGLDRFANRLMFADCIHIVVLDRHQMKAPEQVGPEPVRFRLADLTDLHAMSKRPELDLRADKIQGFLEGDACLLTFVGNELAGYTWAHAGGHPLIFPGLRLKIPDRWLYNYASLTLPKFRGRNLQALRHHALLDRTEWKDRDGLMGYVRYTNWASRAGLAKSGYRELGRLWLFGFGERLVAWAEPKLRELGVGRLPTMLDLGTAEPLPTLSVAAEVLSQAAEVASPAAMSNVPPQPATPQPATPQVAPQPAEPNRIPNRIEERTPAK